MSEVSGSGQCESGKRRRVEEHLVALKVGELQRKGALADGVGGTISWDQAGRSLVKIGFRTSVTNFHHHV